MEGTRNTGVTRDGFQEEWDYGVGCRLVRMWEGGKSNKGLCWQHPWKESQLARIERRVTEVTAEHLTAKQGKNLLELKAPNTKRYPSWLSKMDGDMDMDLSIHPT